MVNTGQESAIIDLLRTVAKERGEARTVFETAARIDSKGNGEAEKAVQSIEEMVRTLMVDLEERCGEQLSVTEPFFEWLMEHACDLLNKCHVRKGNQTAWEAMKKGDLTRETCTGLVPQSCTDSLDPCRAAWSMSGGRTAFTWARSSPRENTSWRCQTARSSGHGQSSRNQKECPRPRHLWTRSRPARLGAVE